MRKLFWIIFIFFLSCSNPKSNSDTKTSNLNQNTSNRETHVTNDKPIKDSSDCPMMQFVKSIDKYKIDAQYLKCEPIWKSRLKIYLSEKLVFTADSLMEFDFNNNLWTDYLKISKDTMQILLEVDDRPFINYILCLTLADDTVINKIKIPLLENEPFDFDGDGKLEYAGFLTNSNGYTHDSCYYNPIWYIEKGLKGFIIDTQLIKINNYKFYGKYHGMNLDQKIKLKEPPLEKYKKYLNLK